jgi:D-amino-acid dehydrogenase
MRIIVLGAGVVGIAAAWFLRQDGHDVTVVEAREGAALETSFANAGHLAAGSGPWAAPDVPMKLLKWIGREDAPILLRPRLDPALVNWGLKFLSNCTAARYAQNAVAIGALCNLSVVETATLRQSLGIDDEFSPAGALTLYGHAHELEGARAKAERIARAGLSARVVEQKALPEVEPALAHVAHEYAGGLLAQDAGTGDAQKFTTSLAAACTQAGVRFRYSSRVDALEFHNGVVRGLKLAGGERVDAEAIVLAAGPWSALLARPLGLTLPIYPGRGYSVTIPIAGHAGAPKISVIDEHAKLYFTRYRDRLRVAGTLELNGFNPMSQARADATLGKLRRMYPDGGDFSQALRWSAMRPMTPDGRPLLGASGIPGLWLDCGHGPLGWTMAAGSGRVLADLVAGRAPPIDATPHTVARFR